MEIGVDYYPELREQSSWQRDAEVMAKTGVKLIRVGKNLWCRFEPHENDFHFEMLDILVSIFAHYGISTVICIPTGKTPLWLKDNCINSRRFIECSFRLINEMSKHYSQNKAVAEWQIDSRNEFCSSSCDKCDIEFRKWLKEKYCSVNQLNNALGNIADGFEYTEWEQIKLDEGYGNPSFILERQRFLSDKNKDYIRLQASVIRKNIPDAKISVSLESMNPYNEFELVDKVYYDAFIKNDVFKLDFARCVIGEKFGVIFNFGKSEPVTGTLRGYALQSFAHGAETVFFKWQSLPSGKNMLERGLLDHNGVPSRRFFEFGELCKTAYKLEKMKKTVTESDIAIIYSPNSKIAFDYLEDMEYETELRRIHEMFGKYGANVDIVNSARDLSSYSLVIAPNVYLSEKDVTENIYRYVIGGGTLVMTARSGVANSVGNCISETLPTVFRELIGAEITNYNSSDEQVFSDYKNQTFKCNSWCEVLKKSTAKTYATYNSGLYKGCTAITVNDYCKGKAYYIGTIPNDEFYMDFVSKLMKYNEIPRLKGMPDGVEVTTITSENEDFIIFFNNSPERHEIDFPKALYSVLDDMGKDKIVLEPYDIDIVER